MPTLSQDQLKGILQNAPQGTTPEGILSGLEQRGYTFEGLHNSGNTLANQQLQTQSTLSPQDQQSANPGGLNVPTLFPAVTNESPLQAGLKATGNIISDLPQAAIGVAKQGYNILNLPNTISQGIVTGIEDSIGLVKDAGSFKEAAKIFAKEVPQQAGAVAKSLKDQYGSLSNLQREATNHPIQTGAAIYALLYGGAQAIDTATGTTGASEALSNATGKVGGGVINTAEAVPKAAYGLAKGTVSTVGNAIGVGGKSILGTAGEAVLGTRGSSAIGTTFETPQLVNAFRNGEQNYGTIASNVKDAISVLNKNSKEAFNSVISQVPETPVDQQAITNTVESTIKDKLGLDANGEIDFAGTSIEGTPEQKIVSNLYDKINKWSDWTAKGVLKLRQNIDKSGFYRGGDNYTVSDGIVTAVRQDLNNAVVEQAPEVGNALSSATQNINTLENMKSTLIGRSGNIEITPNRIRSLAQALDNPLRKQDTLNMLKQLDTQTGSNLVEQVQAAHAAEQYIKPVAGLSSPLSTLRQGAVRAGGYVAGKAGTLIPEARDYMNNLVGKGTEGGGISINLGGGSQGSTISPQNIEHEISVSASGEGVAKGITDAQIEANPKALEARINDIAGKLDKFSPGLGDKFMFRVDLNTPLKVMKTIALNLVKTKGR